MGVVLERACKQQRGEQHYDSQRQQTIAALNERPRTHSLRSNRPFANPRSNSAFMSRINSAAVLNP